jgi:hypothetical protein
MTRKKIFNNIALNSVKKFEKIFNNKIKKAATSE